MKTPFSLALIVSAGVATSGCAHYKKRATTSEIDQHFEITSDHLPENKPEYKVSVDSYVESVRQFAFNELGMPANNFFTEKATEKPKVMHRLYIIEKNSDIPDTWTNKKWVGDGNHFFEVNSHLHLFSYFDSFEDEKKYYTDKGFDVYYWESKVYASADGTKITPYFNEKSFNEKCRSVIHESWHYEIRHKFDGEYPQALNESGATFVAYISCIEFTRSFFGEESDEYEESIKAFNQRNETSKKINSLIEEHNDVQPSPQPPKLPPIDPTYFDPIVDSGEFEVSYTISELWQERPYTKHFPLFYDVYQSVGFEKSLSFLRMCDNQESACVDFMSSKLP